MTHVVKGKVHCRNSNSVIIYTLSRRSKPAVGLPNSLWNANEDIFFFFKYLKCFCPYGM